MITSKDVLELIDKELKKFPTKTEFAKEKLKLSRTDFNSLIGRLKGKGGGFNYNIKILNLLGYEYYLFFNFITFTSSSNFKILIFLSSFDSLLFSIILTPYV